MTEFRVDEYLELRLLQESDIDELVKTVQENLPHLEPWMIWANDYDVESTKSFVRKNLETVANGGPPSFGIFYREKLAGCIGFVKLDRETHVAEIGYWISVEHEGKGIVTKCCRVLIDHAFNDQQMKLMEIRASSANVRSRAVAERLGFTLDKIDEGVHPMPGGKFDDLAVYLLQKNPAASDLHNGRGRKDLV
jgi:ribosomal-protein-serine acetyltransferase